MSACIEEEEAEEAGKGEEEKGGEDDKDGKYFFSRLSFSFPPLFF
jgi:hypothetical protein